MDSVSGGWEPGGHILWEELQRDLQLYVLVTNICMYIFI